MTRLRRLILLRQVWPFLGGPSECALAVAFLLAILAFALVGFDLAR